MSLLDAITGGAYERAAKANQFAINSGTRLGADALTNGTAMAQGYLGVNTTGAGQNSLTALRDSYGTARTDLMNGSNQAQAYLGKLGDSYGHMVQGGQNAYDAYLNATGANGQAGSQAAQAAFQASPGYQYAMDQALGAVQRSAAARGGLAGGNATTDILRTATGLADQNYQQYINNLGNAAQSYGTGLAGQGQGYLGQANAAQGLGTQLASLGQTFGQNQAGVYGTAAQQQAQFGQGVAGLQMSAADALVKNNNTLAQGQTQSSNNFLGALLGGASSVFGAAGKAGGFGNLFS
ncbi:hypothetical protein [Methylobacterium indicum]|uniref:DNA injection protein n=1 Tax=Methylobacterium indicum TaxID=1775910 RepID=A0ABR5HGJ3_9HYPH|nr:hypothetical protein [Methylobacterium indicum]KMO22984.1 hypothetical protein QR78_05625 [Methylobacterium indicum]KMO25676.1 hypothetical protein QR79_06460 [Methylobacterium indicum]